MGHFWIFAWLQPSKINSFANKNQTWSTAAAGSLSLQNHSRYSQCAAEIKKVCIQSGLTKAKGIYNKDDPSGKYSHSKAAHSSWEFNIRDA